MKFYNYINEQKDKIAKMAEPFMNEFGDKYENDAFIWRGHRGVYKNFTAKQRRKDRKPRLVNQELHEYLSKISVDLFGWDLRKEGIFTGSKDLAQDYGNQYIFIPLENYRYVWTKDYIAIYHWYDEFSNPSSKTKTEDIKRRLYELYKDNYKTTGLSKFNIKSYNFEAIFDCDKYLLVEPNFWYSTMKERML